MMKIIETTETEDMSDITIPPAALRAARAASMNALGDGDDSVKAACLAMLRAWPGMEIIPVAGTWPPFISLPLPKERRNGEG